MPTFDSLAAKQRGNVLKATTSALFVAPMSAPIVDSVYDEATGELLPLPSGYEPVGWVDGDDGITWGRETDTSEVIGHGSAFPVRTDITQDTTTVQCKFLEYNATTLGLAYSQSTKAVREGLNRANRQVTVDTPLTPSKLNYRFLAIGRDRGGDEAIYIVRHIPSATVSEYGEQVWNNEDSPGFDVTLSAEPDDTAGFAVRTILCGPGLTDERLTAMGFDPAGSGGSGNGGSGDDGANTPGSGEEGADGDTPAGLSTFSTSTRKSK